MELIPAQTLVHHLQLKKVLESQPPPQILTVAMQNQPNAMSGLTVAPPLSCMSIEDRIMSGQSTESRANFAQLSSWGLSNPSSEPQGWGAWNIGGRTPFLRGADSTPTSSSSGSVASRELSMGTSTSGSAPFNADHPSLVISPEMAQQGWSHLQNTMIRQQGHEMMLSMMASQMAGSISQINVLQNQMLQNQMAQNQRPPRSQSQQSGQQPRPRRGTNRDTAKRGRGRPNRDDGW